MRSRKRKMKNLQDINIYIASADKLCAANPCNWWNVKHNAYLKISLCEKCQNTEFFSGLYFPTFELNTERYSVSLRIEFECGKIRTEKNSVVGHFSHSVYVKIRFITIDRDYTKW